MQTIHEIANTLIELVRGRKFVEAYEHLYDDNVTSVDPLNKEQSTIKGLNNLINREKSFLARSVIHEVRVSQPIIAGSYFTVSMYVDVTIEDLGKMIVDELCIYKVAEGKIICQQFFVG